MLADRIAIIRGGRLIATGHGDVAQRAYLGQPIRWSCAWPGRSMARLVSFRRVRHVVATGADWLRYRDRRPQDASTRVSCEPSAEAGHATW